ncbi:MAG: Farnesyl diphosphate synthase [bacterium ADurb.Bin429]|nr:MAG: Farnesyl diphosphate synthase [bacterium ADurb.Bin429]
MTDTFNKELQQIAARVRAIFADDALRPDFAPETLLEAALAYPSAGGKALRPALLAWCCRMLDGPEDAAVRAGAAVELYHTYTLVHDDVIDRDPLRRGQPSVHARMAKIGRAQFQLDNEETAHYGLSMAILAGDCLHCWAVKLLATLPALGADPAVALRLVERLQGVVGPAIVEGEARDIELPFTPVAEVTEAEMLQVIRTKTAALFAYCGWAGGLLARGVEDDAVRALAAFAEHAGIAFQLQDDVLGLIADEATLGKPVGNDLREGKRTLIIALGWARASAAQRAELAAVLGNQQAGLAEIAAATGLLRQSGAIADVQALASRYLDQALGHLAALPASPALALLRELAARMVIREK